jgi:hypothetical protein
MADTIGELAAALKAHGGLNDEQRRLFVDAGIVMRVVLDDELRRLQTVERELAKRR